MVPQSFHRWFTSYRHASGWPIDSNATRGRRNHRCLDQIKEALGLGFPEFNLAFGLSWGRIHQALCLQSVVAVYRAIVINLEWRWQLFALNETGFQCQSRARSWETRIPPFDLIPITYHHLLPFYPAIVWSYRTLLNIQNLDHTIIIPDAHHIVEVFPLHSPITSHLEATIVYRIMWISPGKWPSRSKPSTKKSRMRGFPMKNGWHGELVANLGDGCCLQAHSNSKWKD